MKWPNFLGTALLLMGSALLFGGASRLDVAPPLLVRTISVICIISMVWRTRFGDWQPGVRPTILWAAILCMPLIQLIPLPWEIWTALPGRGYASEVYRVIGTHPLHALSLTPDRTINAWGALLPALAAYLVCLRLSHRGRAMVFFAIVPIVIMSAALGLIQVAGGPDSSAYFYAITNNDSSVGFFANANHHALFLCAGITIVFFVVSEIIVKRPHLLLPVAAFSALMICLIFLSIFETGSRAGAILSVFAFLGGATMLPLHIVPLKRRYVAISFGAIGLGLCILVGLGLDGVLFGHSLMIDEESRQRITNIPIFARIIGDYFPFGSGLGSFDPIFRGYEAPSSLTYSYLNNAHNDYAQILIETGIFGGFLMVFFLIIWLASIFKSFRENYVDDMTASRSRRAAAMITFLLMLHSFVDYPLRTGALSALFAFCIAILLSWQGGAKSVEHSSPPATPRDLADADMERAGRR